MTIIFSSVTYALKAQKLLDFRRIRTMLVRSPAVTTVRGCGYGLRLSNGEESALALELLTAGGIRISGAVEEGN